MDVGDSQADVETNAVDAAMEKVSTTQKNLIDHYTIQASKMRRLGVAMKAMPIYQLPLWSGTVKTEQ